QIADRLGVSVREVDRLRGDAQQRFALSIYDAEGDHRPAPLDVLCAPDAEPADALAEHGSLVAHLDSLLERLPARERGIVGAYFYDGLTLREIAEGLGLTEARISQILSKTLRSLRAQFDDAPVAEAA
ncbi:MAG TPA: sigma-70 family RNA polymerase sigma factor, partial [Rubricoccaceae bacterium]